ncbi:MAG: WecB/TagA/CpsF family glycosyltransferase [Patescibacteria group bacterium]
MSDVIKSTYQSSKFDHLDLFGSSYDQLLTLLQEQIDTGIEPYLVMTPNPEQVMLSRKNKVFLDHLQSANLRIPDGIGLVLASRWHSLWSGGRSIQQRITGVDVMQDLLEYAKQRSKRVLIVGGKDFGSDSGKIQIKHATYWQLDIREFSGLDAGPDVGATSRSTTTTTTFTTGAAAVESADEVLVGGTEEGKEQGQGQKKHTKAVEIFWTPGFEEVRQQTEAEKKQLKQIIMQVRPSIVFVAFGAPDQEAWLIEWQSVLQQAGVVLAMVVGGAPDILLGKISRAPKTMQQLGLEWLYRLWQQPWRWRRQVRLLEFIWYAIRSPWL